MRFTYLIIVIFVFLGCSQGGSYQHFKLSEKEKIVTRMEKRVTSNLSKKYGLIPLGTGGQMMNEVKKLRLVFNYPNPLTEDQARVLATNVTEDYLAVINQEETLRQYLANYPFGPKNVEIIIFLQDSQGRSIQPEKFLLIETSNGFVTCEANTQGTHEYRTVFKETFEEAKKKATEQL